MSKKYGKRYSNIRECFADNTERDENGCLIWTRSRNEKGYGIVYHDGRTQRAHRVAYELEHGPIPKGVLIDHTCYEPACVDLAHLRPATRAQNGANRAGAKSSTGYRNVYHHTNGYIVVVEKNTIRHGSWHKRIEDAVAEASLLREQLFGEFAGKG